MANPKSVSNAIMVGVVMVLGLMIVGFFSDKPVWFWFALPVLLHVFGHDLHHDYRVDLLFLGLDLPERGWRWRAVKLLKV